MMGGIGGLGLLILLLIYLIPFIFIAWMIVRFVKAHEKMADGIQEIKLQVKKLSSKNDAKNP